MRLKTNLVALLGLCFSCCVCSRESIDDPIFESPIARKVFDSFEVRSRGSLIAKCGELAANKQLNSGSFRVFAEIVRPDLYVVIIDNERFRGIVANRNGECRVEPVAFPMQGKPDRVILSDSEMEDLFLDILKRYSAAFGSKEAFLEWLDASMTKLYSACKGRGLPRWMCYSGYGDMLPSQTRALDRFKESRASQPR